MNKVFVLLVVVIFASFCGYFLINQVNINESKKDVGLNFDLPIDTNWQTSWSVLDSNLKLVYPTISNVGVWIDGNKVVDTNAETACGDGEVLYGDGVCRVPIQSTTYFPDSATISGGTIVDNNIELMWYYGDGIFEVQEGAGLNPLDLNILFTDVNSFDKLIVYLLGIWATWMKFIGKRFSITSN